MYFTLMILLVLLCCMNAGFSGKKQIFDDYMSPERTSSIKGVFAVIIVMSHLLSYVTVSGGANLFVRKVIIIIGQLMVTMFFFYSGYGIIESCRRKAGYMKTFFVNRFLRTLLHFDMAIILFAVANALMGKPNRIKSILMAFTGWSGIGNSNWFMFCTFALYLITIPVFLLLGKRLRVAIGVMWAATVALALFLREEKGDYWWYNTLLCYPLGMLWSELRTDVEQRIRKDIRVWWVLMMSVLALFITGLVIYIRRQYGYSLPDFLRSMDLQYFYMVFACIFCLVVVVSQMRLRTHNTVLRWLGVHSFSIYILQRIPMRTFQALGLAKRPELFIFLVVASTLLIAPAFTWLTGKVDSVLFKKKGISAASKH